MLKPFPDRVKSTYELILSICKYGDRYSQDVIENKLAADKHAITQKTISLDLELDTTVSVPFDFEGYEATYIKSKVTTGQRLLYDRSKPFKKEIDYFNTYRSVKEVSRPQAYIIPQSWHKVIDRLKQSNIEMTTLTSDKLILVDAYFIEKVETKKNPYEGHYLHHDVQVKKRKQNILFQKGDLYDNLQSSFEQIHYGIIRTARDGLIFQLEFL